MSLIKKILYILSWIPAFIFSVVALILGLIAVPIALLFSRWPKILWLWGNDEEGCPMWWDIIASAGTEGRIAQRFPCFWWYAIRNPVNNARYIFKDREANISGNWVQSSMEAQDMIDHYRDDVHQWRWSGPFAGYRRVWLTEAGKYSEFWIGWKVGSTVPGMGFTLQYRRNRKIGTWQFRHTVKSTWKA